MQIIVCWNFLVLDSIPLSNIPTPHQKHQANSLMKQNKSLKFISFLQTLAIILVVTGHSLHEYPENNGFSTLVYHLIYSFHMPLFIFISGYLFRYTQTNKETPQPYSTFFKKKFQRLIVPYLFLCAITFVPRALMSAYADEPIEISFHNFIGSLLYTDKMSIPYLWFLPAIFILLNISYFTNRLFRQLEPAILFILLAIGFILNLTIGHDSITLLAISRALFHFVFFILGICYATYQHQLNVLNNIPSLLIFFAIWLCTAFISRNGNEVVALVCSISGIAFCTVMSILVADKIKFLTHLEGFSFMIYLLSWYTEIFCQQVLHSFTDFAWWVYTILAIATSIYAPWAIGKILFRYSSRSKIARHMLFLLGH